MTYKLYDGDGHTLWRSPVVEHEQQEIIAQLEDKIINLHEGYRKQLLNLEKFKAMVTNLNLGLLVVDNDDIITKVFPSFEVLTGYSENELVGKRAKDILLRKGDVISNLQIKEQQILREKTNRVFMKYLL